VAVVVTSLILGLPEEPPPERDITLPDLLLTLILPVPIFLFPPEAFAVELETD